MSERTLTIDEFTTQLSQCGIHILSAKKLDYQVVIRGEQGDFGLAAVHRDRDGTTLILDIGRKLED